MKLFTLWNVSQFFSFFVVIIMNTQPISDYMHSKSMKTYSNQKHWCHFLWFSTIDMVKNISDKISLFGLFRYGIDSRTFELVPFNIIKIRITDVAIINGFELSIEKNCY